VAHAESLVHSPSAPDAWPLEAIWQAVEPELPGFTVERVAEVDSTNAELMRRARDGRVDPVLLVADRQTAGRGRMGRAWYSGAGPDFQGPPGPTRGAQTADFLTFSVGLALVPTRWSGLSLAVGVALAESLHPALQLKWPNDLWWERRKVGGILIETANTHDSRFVVIGVGLNIRPPHLPSLEPPPAGLCDFLPDATAQTTLGCVVQPLLQAVKQFSDSGFAPFQARFRQRDALLGLPVVCSDATAGVAEGVDADGALMLRTASGLRCISSAEVSVRPGKEA